MELKEAELIAKKVIDVLSPVCSRIQIAGSIRRRKPFVHDIDLVCIPSNQGQFLTKLQSLGKITMGGNKLIRVNEPPLDVYIATPET